jgi:hypothetical protein
MEGIMRITVDSIDGGAPFEIFTTEDNQLDLVPGWYYGLLVKVEGGYECAGDGAPDGGPFQTMKDAFVDAINCNYAPAGKSCDKPGMW